MRTTEPPTKKHQDNNKKFNTYLYILLRFALHPYSEPSSHPSIHPSIHHLPIPHIIPHRARETQSQKAYISLYQQNILNEPQSIFIFIIVNVSVYFMECKFFFIF